MSYVFIFLLLSTFVLANNKEISAFEKEALKDLPAPTVENLRWNLEPERWFWKDEYLMKGKYYKVPLDKGNDMSTRLIKVFSNKELKGKPLFRVQNQYTIYYGDEKKSCDVPFNEKLSKPKYYLQCRVGYCVKVKDDGGREIADMYHLKRKRLREDPQECLYKVDVVTVSKGSIDVPPPPQNSSYNVFKYISVDPVGQYLEILVNDKPAYLDIRHCKNLQYRVKCGELHLAMSEYEKAWIELKKVQKEKSHKMLNLSLEKVLPCVKKRDKACVQKYFMTKEMLESVDDWFVKTEFTEDTFKELEACLKYESLLPHQLATRGIKKACIFEFDTTGLIFQNVTYPEAIGGGALKLIEE